MDFHRAPEARLTGFVQLFFDDLSVGMEAQLTKTVGLVDIVGFAGISGDNNPIHLDESYASKSRFGERIAHGMLVGSYISAVIGTRLPGPGAIYMAQQLYFRAPVRIGAEVVTRVRITELFPEKSRVKLACTCHVGEELVIEGEALLFVPVRPAA